MSDLSLYESCLRKVAIYLRNGIYYAYHENPFSTYPHTIVNDLVPATIDVHRENGLNADDLELLLTSGTLRELKIHRADFFVDNPDQFVSQILRYLMLGCTKLEVLHLTSPNFNIEHLTYTSEALNNVLNNCPNLKYLASSSPFDLKNLRICKKLRCLRLLFRPRQPLFEFLERESDHFLPHKYLIFLSVSVGRIRSYIPCNELVVILRNCPELTSLGEIETSEALQQLHDMNIPPSELKLRHCYWSDEALEDDYLVTYTRVRDAVEYYPVIEELDLLVYSIGTVYHITNLSHLVYLNIVSCRYESRMSEALGYVLREIGFQLKHLSFEIDCPVDISLLLKDCPNLESLKFVMSDAQISASSVVHLSCLQRLCFAGSNDVNLGHVFQQFSGCNQLTDLFLEFCDDIDDKILGNFLENNSLSNLKLAFIWFCRLTENGFREFLLSAPQLERIAICDADDDDNDNFERVAIELNHNAIFNENSLDFYEEFFSKRFLRNFSCCNV